MHRYKIIVKNMQGKIVAEATDHSENAHSESSIELKKQYPERSGYMHIYKTEEINQKD